MKAKVSTQSSPNADSRSLVDAIGFDLIGSDLGQDVESALQLALAGGAVFPNGSDPMLIFRDALSTSICDIESHPRGRLFQEFLRKGPYEDGGEIPLELVDLRLSDAETASAITFIFSYMINSFKGAVAELLAAKKCAQLLQELQDKRELPANARLYACDAVSVRRAKGNGYFKGADLYILVEDQSADGSPTITVAGVIEVKSYRQSKNRLRRQLNLHIQRAKRGLRVNGVDYPPQMVNVGYGRERRVVRVAALPSSWKLSRSFRYEESENGRFLHVDRRDPPEMDDKMEQVNNSDWRIALRWSKEALAEAGYEMTFWYMEKIGEFIYAQSVPQGWEEMSPAEAGRNAVKMMLYYAILRCRTIHEQQRAIALYNSYGFGCALGMNFKNAAGRREMLWSEDLDEILASGENKHGYTIR